MIPLIPLNSHRNSLHQEPSKNELARSCKIVQEACKNLACKTCLARARDMSLFFSCMILAQSCNNSCKILWKPRRANIDVLNPDTKSEIPTRKMKSRHESEIPTRNPDMKSEIPTRNPDMKSEIPTRNPDMKSDCVILIRAHQNFLSRRPLPSQTVVVRCGN